MTKGMVETQEQRLSLCDLRMLDPISSVSVKLYQQHPEEAQFPFVRSNPTSADLRDSGSYPPISSCFSNCRIQADALHSRLGASCPLYSRLNWLNFIWILAVTVCHQLCTQLPLSERCCGNGRQKGVLIEFLLHHQSGNEVDLALEYACQDLGLGINIASSQTPEHRSAVHAIVFFLVLKENGFCDGFKSFK